MTACNYYPKFEPNQVLTSEQLNQITAYFDKHDRMTRSKLIGAGVVCGFKIKYFTSPVKLEITEGVGITTQGYLIYSPKSELTRYRPYKDPGKYDSFGDENSQIKLWELLPKVVKDEDDAIEKLTADFLKDKAVILYLEKYEQDLETCTGDDCDDKGIRVNHCVKKLLINLTDLNRIIKECSKGKSYKDFDEEINSKFRLPEVSIGRESRLLTKYKYEDYSSIYKLYFPLLKNSIEKIQEALVTGYTTFELVLNGQYSVNPFKTIDVVKNVEKYLSKYEHSIQYVYDYLKDIISAYDEFKENAFDLASACCYKETCFERHLMLGEAIPVDKCEHSVYRHSFISAPIYNGQNELLDKVKLLFKRLVYVVSSFNLEEAKSLEVKVTPSDEKKSELSERAIPYYYAPVNKDRFLEEEVLLYHIWQYEYNKKCKPYLNRGYYSVKYKEKATPDFITDPLLYDHDKYGFYRIEGLLNKPCSEVLPGLLKEVESNNLPFKVIKLRLGAEPKEEELNLDCRFSDLELMYKSLVTEYLCFLHHKIKYFAELDFGSEEPEKKQPGSIKGVVYIAGSEVLPGVNVTLKNASNENYVAGAATNQNGAFTFNNIPQGNYLVSVDYTGFKSYSNPVTVQSGKTEYVKVQLETAAPGPTTPGISGEYYGPGYEGFGYADMSKSFGLGARYSPEEIAKMFTTSVYSKGDFLKKSSGYKLTENSVGNLYLNYSKYGGGDVINYIDENIDKFSNTIGGYSKGNIIEKYYRPVKLIEAIEALASSIPDKIVNFNEGIVEAREKELIETATDYRNSIYDSLKNPDYKRTGRESEIIIHLTELIEKCLLKQFRSLIASYKKRVAEVLKLTLFYYFVKDHSGAVHMAGVPVGGTFIIVCNEKGIVVADFALPYICCSDCPPITYVAAPVQVVFKLPKENFCYDDDTDYTVIAEPAGGVVKGDGVSQDPQSGEYKFNPKKAGEGLKKLTYAYNLNTYELIVLVIKVAPAFTYSFKEPEPDSPKRTVKFTGLPADAESYKWDFGDGSSSTEKDPVNTFDLTDDQEFDVTLTVTKKGCTEPVTETIVIPYCTAEFVYKVEKIVDDIAVVSFDSLMKEAEKYSWKFGDGNKSAEADPVNKYDPVNNGSFNVVLKVKNGDCTDEEERTITIEKCPSEFGYEWGSPEGNRLRAYFWAKPPDADEYLWDFGDGTTSKLGPDVEHEFILDSNEKKIAVKLTIKKGICISHYENEIVLPPAEKIAFGLKYNIYCKYDDTAYPFELSTDGEVKGNGVEKRDNKFVFIPANDEVKEGINKFIFTSSSGQQTELTVKVLNPVADFKVIDVEQPNPETDPATYIVLVENVSTGAAKYVWRIGDEKVSEEEKPKLIITSAEPGMAYTIKLTAINDKCSTTMPKEVTIPTRPTPSGSGDDIMFETYNPDNVIVGGAPDDMTLLDNIVDLYVHNVKNFNNITSHSMFETALTTNTAAYRDTKKYLSTVIEELSDSQRRRLYVSGAKNNEIAEMVGGLLETIAKRIKQYEGTGAKKQKQFTYNLVLLNLSQTFNLLALQKKDLEAGGKIQIMFKQTFKILSEIKEMGVEVNPNDRLNEMIRSTFRAAENKPVLMTELERLSMVING